MKGRFELNKDSQMLSSSLLLTVVANYFEDSELALQKFLIHLENVGYSGVNICCWYIITNSQKGELKTDEENKGPVTLYILVSSTLW